MQLSKSTNQKTETVTSNPLDFHIFPVYTYIRTTFYDIYGRLYGGYWCWKMRVVKRSIVAGTVAIISIFTRR